MALQLDPFQQIVNVQWGGSIFVVAYQWFGANPESRVYTTTQSSSEEDTSGGSKKWKVTYSSKGWPPNGDESKFMVSKFPGGGVYAEIGEDNDPVFVLAGSTVGSSDIHSDAQMMDSRDGKTWTQRTIQSDGVVNTVTWDEEHETFYAGAIVFEEGDNLFYDITVKSTDGHNWSQISKTELGVEVPPNIESHCSTKIRDRNGYRVPTSVFGYNDDQDLLIAPDPINMTFGADYPAGEPINHGDQLKIIRGPRNDDPGQKTVALPSGMNRVWVVGFAGGTWQAAGEAGSPLAHGVVATSTDNGETWKITLTEADGSAFTTVAGKAGSKPPTT